MATEINFVVAKTSPNLYNAAKSANLPKDQVNQIEQFSWTVQKNKKLMQMPVEKAKLEFDGLDATVQEKLKFLYPDAEYTKPNPDAGDQVVGAVKKGATLLASPLIGLFKAAGAWSRVINTPYLMARQASQGEGLFSKQTFTDAWDGRRVFDHGALKQAVDYFGNEKVEVAKGLIAGKKPGQIIESYGKVDQKLLDAIEEAFNNPDEFRQVLDGVRYAQVNPGNDIARLFDTKPSKNAAVDYIDGRTKNVSGFINFFYQIAVDPLTYATGGLSTLAKVPALGKVVKPNTTGTQMRQTIEKYGPGGVRQIFADNKQVVELWDNQLGPKIKEFADATDDVTKSRIRRDIGDNFRGYDNDVAIKMLVDNKIYNAESALNYFSKAENVSDYVAGRVDGMQYFRNGIATARNQRRLDFGLGKLIDRQLNPSFGNVEDIEKAGKDTWDVLIKAGRDGDFATPAIDDIKNFHKEMTLREKMGLKFARSPQGRVIKIGEDAIKTADVFRDTARQVLPRDLSDYLTFKFINSDANDQVAIVKSLYYSIMQRYGLDGHPKGKEFIEKELSEKFGSREGLAVTSKLEVNPEFSEVLGKTGLKLENDVMTYESTSIIHPFQETGAIGSLDYAKIAQVAYDVKSKKNLLLATGGATQSKLASDLVSFWSLFTLFPRLGIRSALDEGFLYYLTAPAQQLFDFASRKGHKLGRVATAYTGSKSSETLRVALKRKLGFETPSEALSLEAREEALELYAKKNNISVDQLTSVQRGFAQAERAVELFGKGITDEEAQWLIQALAYNSNYLTASTRSIAGSASLTGKFDGEVAEKLVDPNNFEAMLKELDTVSGSKGTIVDTGELARLRSLGNRGVAAVHFENFIKRFYRNRREITGTNGKRLFDPVSNFFTHNALKTAKDFSRARNDGLKSVGLELNIDFIKQWDPDVIPTLDPKLLYIVKDEVALKDFLTMSSRTTELRQRGFSDVEIARDQVERILLDMYNTFHGGPGKFNSGLLNKIQTKYKELEDIEKETLTPVPGKWNQSARSIEFSDFEKLTENYQPVGRMFTTLEIEGVTDFESAYTKLGNNMMEIMDRQVTGILRQPAVMVAYTRIRKNYDKVEKSTIRNTYLSEVQRLREKGINPSESMKQEILDNVTDRINKQFTEIGIQQASDIVLKYADNPNVRTNFALSARNVGRYYRATEDFWRRTLRLRDVAPRAFVRMRLAHLGLDASGDVYEDSNGDPYIMMPMDNVIFKTVDGTVRTLTGNGAFQQPMFNDFTLKLKLANPSFSPDAGVPTLSGPIAALSVLGMKGVLGQFGTTGKQAGEELDNYALGSIGEGMDVVRAVVPASLQKAYAALPFNEKSRQEVTAAMQAIAYNASQGRYLDANATEKEKAEYLKNIRISAHNIVAMRSILGILSPVSPSVQESVGVPDYLKEVGITGLRPEFYDIVNAITKKYKGDIQDPYELAVATFIGRNPNKLIYTVSRDDKKTNVIIQKTEALKKWTIDNQGLINTYGEAAFIFAPHTGDFDAATYNWLEAADLIGNKSLEQYYQDILVAKDKQAYYDIARNEKEELSRTTSISLRKAVIATSTKQRQYLKASNPLLDAALTAGGNEVATEVRMLTSLEQMLVSNDLNVPKEIKQKMLILTSKVREFITLSTDPEARNAINFSGIKSERKAEINKLISDLSEGDMSVKEANRAIFRAILDYYSRDTYKAYERGF